MKSVSGWAGTADRLRAKLKPLLGEVSVRMQLIAEDEHVRELYVQLLRVYFEQVRATESLLYEAEREAREQSSADPIARGLVDWLIEHEREAELCRESLLQDYEATGSEPSRLTDGVNTPAINAMMASVYYWTLQVHPIAILGYLTVLVSTPPGAASIDLLQSRTGYPERAFQTLRLYAERSADYADELFALIDRCRLTREHTAIVSIAAVETGEQLIAAIDELRGVGRVPPA